MTKVGGTAKRSKIKSPTKTTAQRIDVSASWSGPDSGIEVRCHKVFFVFETFINTAQHCNTFVTWHYITLHYNTLQRRYTTLHYTINFNTKITIQKKPFGVHSLLGYRVQRQSPLPIKFVHFVCFNTYRLFLVSYLILTLDEN